jgi:chromate transport protein ChrA
MVTILKIVHDRWRISWIEPILTAVRPAMGIIMNGFATLVLKATGKSYPEKTLVVLLIISLLLMRFLVVSITG